jgi:hypothetical protein
LFGVWGGFRNCGMIYEKKSDLKFQFYYRISSRFSRKFFGEGFLLIPKIIQKSAKDSFIDTPWVPSLIKVNKNGL